MEGMVRKTGIRNRKGGEYPRRLECPLALLGRDKGRRCKRKNNGRIDGWNRLDNKGRRLWSNVGKDKRGKKRK